MSQPPSSEEPVEGAPAQPAVAGGDTGEGSAQVSAGRAGSQLPATGPVVLDASFVIALLRREPGASALAHVLPRGVMTSVTAGEVFATIAEAGGPDPERVEAVLRALGVRIVDLPLAATRHFPWLRRLDAARRTQQRIDGEFVTSLSVADLCAIGYAATIKAPVITGDLHWATLASHDPMVLVCLFGDLD